MDRELKEVVGHEITAIDGERNGHLRLTLDDGRALVVNGGVDANGTWIAVSDIEYPEPLEDWTIEDLDP